MSAENLLSRLEGVRVTGRDRWLARCPGHEDKSPSLSIRELDDGRVLLHCFAGCSVQEVLAALGLDFEALFPEGPSAPHRPRERRPFPAADALRAVAHEAVVIHLFAKKMAEGAQLTEADRGRILLAASRLNAAADYA